MLKNKLKNFGTVVTYFSNSAEVSDFLDYLKYVNQEEYPKILSWLIQELDTNNDD